MQKTLILWLLTYAAAEDHYLVETINKKTGAVKMKIAAVKAKPKPRRKVSKKVNTAAGSNDYSDVGWMDAVGYDYNNDKPKPSKKTKSKKPKRKKNESCDDLDVKVGRGLISGGHAHGRSTPGRCRIHFECSGGEVCTRDGTCQNIPCTKDLQCKEKVALPSACKSVIPGGQKFCSTDKLCMDSQECLEAGKDFVCHQASGQCKPSYGACFNTCDCLDNFGMVRGEALCEQTHHSGSKKKVCLCRSEELSDCRHPSDVELKPVEPVEPVEQPVDPVEPAEEQPMDPVEPVEQPVDPIESQPSTRPARTPVTIIHTPPPSIAPITSPAPRPPQRDPQVTILHTPPPPRTVIDEVVTDPGMYPGPTTTEKPLPPVTVVEDVVSDPGMVDGPTTMPSYTDSCPLPRNNEPPGGPGAPCNAHTACFMRQGLVCAKPMDGQGKCEKLTCKSDAECASSTSLPTRCSRGRCKVRHCYENSDCPRGYACDSGGQCKQDLGACKYDCDCSQCDAALCFKGHCICKAEHDECTVAPGQESPNYSLRGLNENAVYGGEGGDGNESQKEGGGDGDWEDVNQLDDSNELPTIEHKLEVEPVTRPMEQPLEQAQEPMENKNDGEKYIEGGEGHKQFREEEFNSNKECLTCDCPPGWQKTDAGCYKLFKEKVDKVGKKTAQRMCAKEGGFIAEVTTKKEMVNLQLVFENRVIPVWLGAQRMKGGNFKWSSGVRFTEDQVDDEGNEGGCLIRRAQHKKVVSCEEKFYVLCEVAKIQPAS